MVNIKYASAMSLGSLALYQLWNFAKRFQTEETPEIFKNINVFDAKTASHILGTATIALLAPKLIGNDHFTVNPIKMFMNNAVTISAALGFNYAVSKVYDNTAASIHFVKLAANIAGTTAIALLTPTAIGVESTTAKALIVIPTALLYNAGVNLIYENYIIKPSEIKMHQDFFSFSGWGVKKLAEYTGFFGKFSFDHLSTKTVELGYLAYDIVSSYLSSFYPKTSIIGAVVKKGVVFTTSTALEVIDKSPCLYKVAQTKEYVAVHDFKTILSSLAHVVVTTGLTYALPKTPATKVLIIGGNVAVSWLEGNILNSFAGLQVLEPVTKLGKFGYCAVEGIAMFVGIGNNHKDYAKNHPGTSQDLKSSYQEMKADALTQECTELHEYFWPSEVPQA